MYSYIVLATEISTRYTSCGCVELNHLLDSCALQQKKKNEGKLFFYFYLPSTKLKLPAIKMIFDWFGHPYLLFNTVFISVIAGEIDFISKIYETVGCFRVTIFFFFFDLLGVVVHKLTAMYVYTIKLRFYCHISSASHFQAFLYLNTFLYTLCRSVYVCTYVCSSKIRSFKRSTIFPCTRT